MTDTMTDQDPAPTEADIGPTCSTDAGEQAVDVSPPRIVEAILFAADVPMPAAKIASVLGVGDARDVRRHIAGLNEHYAAQKLSFRIESIAGGYQMLTLPAYNTWLTKLLRARQETKLSPAALETLAIVAYKQPCTRASVEAVRGVAAGDMLNRLREVNLVKIVGRAEDLGRPLLYGTTRRFLEVFGLPSLDDLPQVEALAGGAAAAPPAEAEASPTETAGEPDTSAVAESDFEDAPAEVSETPPQPELSIVNPQENDEPDGVGDDA